MKDFNFGENLRIIRQVKGISQEAMAMSLGISQAKYSRLEAQASVPPVRILEQIAGILGEDPKMLLYGKDTEALLPKIDGAPITKKGLADEVMAVMRGPIGLLVYFGLFIVFGELSYIVGGSFCDGLRTSEETKLIVCRVLGVTVCCYMIYVGYKIWLKKWIG